MLAGWCDVDDQQDNPGSFGSLTAEERSELQCLRTAMESNQAGDTKYPVVRRLLVDDAWLDRGCIVFSQYFDWIWWLANQLSADLANEPIGIYAAQTTPARSATAHLSPNPEMP